MWEGKTDPNCVSQMLAGKHPIIITVTSLYHHSIDDSAFYFWSIHTFKTRSVKLGLRYSFRCINCIYMFMHENLWRHGRHSDTLSYIKNSSATFSSAWVLEVRTALAAKHGSQSFFLILTCCLENVKILSQHQHRIL